jgi:hypothetical protein
MITPLNPNSKLAKDYPELFQKYNTQVASFNTGMAAEAKIVFSLLVGGWAVLIVVSFNAAQFDPAFRSAAIFLIIASVGYSWNRSSRFKNMEKKLLNEIAWKLELTTKEAMELTQ